ncbi:MAG: Pr2TM family membrane protein, partial [Kordiimonadaceae bacterium]|nr:Pr2TM family membrane protein [Kordiimonadaceae bacterium]
MTIKTLRQEKGWSQEHLAQASGLSLRTIQRIERGHKASLESLNCLSAVFETKITNLIQEQKMDTIDTKDQFMKNHDEQEALEYVKNLKGFHMNWISYIFVIAGLYFLNLQVSPGNLWVIYPALGWGFGI